MNIYYQSAFNCLLIELVHLEVTHTKNLDGMTILYHDQQIIGYNIFDTQNLGELKEGLVTLSEEQLTTINQQLEHEQLPLLEKQKPGFIVGRVIDKQAVEGSSKLNICQVDIQSEVLQIVCGASNVDKDQLVVVAVVGSRMPNGLRIVPSTLKGIDSFGMICSKKELQVVNDFNDEGIMVLDHTYQVGQIFER